MSSQVSFAFNPSFLAIIPGTGTDLYEGSLKIEIGPGAAGQIDVIYVRPTACWLFNGVGL